MATQPLPAQAVRDAAVRRDGLVRELRRALHRIPELAFQEVETTRFVADFLARRGILFEPAACGTGGVAAIGPADGPAVLLRADLDALPVEEPPGGADGCRSRHPGLMHACGHDAHTAMLLAAADALADPELGFRGRAVCVFQPAEEGSGGCQRLLDEGLLARHPARAAVALHVWPGLAAGQVGLGPGPRMAGMDRVTLTVRGRGGHGAYPHACVDPVVLAAEAVVALQTVVSRRIDPLEPALLTLGAIHGGTACNIIPDEVEILGTIRYYERAVRARLIEGIDEVCRGVALAHGGSCEVRIDEGYPVTANDPAATAALAEALAGVLAPGAVVPGSPSMGSEDMGCLLGQVPGCYLQLGSSLDPERAPPLHSPRFAVAEECLAVGVQALLTAAFAM